ncbi:hypothetical protein ACFYXH_30055 [Streptomyces sp. NPDC002730]|uniref:hypothetical protein n=1 Tax=Streptomyces sp. NPDC002730 TaxID=3364662 RepID=UPI0036BA16CE
MGRVTGGWKAMALGAVVVLGLVTGCGEPGGKGGHDEAWRPPSAPPSLSPSTTSSTSSTSSAPATPSPSVPAKPSGSASAGSPAPGPTTTAGAGTGGPATGDSGGSGGSGGSNDGGGGGGGTSGNGGGSGGAGEPEPPTAPPPPSQQAPAGGTDGFPYDGDLCGGDHGPYIQVHSGSGAGRTGRLVIREGHFTCHGKDRATWTATGGTARPFPLNENAHITVTTPFAPAGQRKAITASEFLTRINAYGEKQTLVFHYQTDPELIWILNQIDPAQY